MLGRGDGLREGEEFFYIEIRGLAPEQVGAGKRLCAMDREGELLRDSPGCRHGLPEGGSLRGAGIRAYPGGRNQPTPTPVATGTGLNPPTSRTRHPCHGKSGPPSASPSP
mgnify:CR=1 FL=1